MEAVIGCAVFVVLVLLAYRYGYPSRFTLLDYQRGMLYRKGFPARELGPGHYWVWTRREKVFFMDTRPIQGAYENQGVILRDGNSATFGILASARVAEVRKVTYAARNYNQLPTYIFLCTARSVLNGYTAKHLVERGKDALGDEITSHVKSKLGQQGFELLSFRLTQLSLPPSNPTSYHCIQFDSRAHHPPQVP